MADHDKPHELGGKHEPGKHEPDKPHELGRTHPAAGQETNRMTGRVAPGYESREGGSVDPHQGEHVAPMSTDQAVTEPSSPPHVGGRAMYVLVGPYKGSVLIMPEDEAENAKDNHWAIDQADMEPPFDAANPYEHDHDLTDEDRENAVREADEWAAKVNAPPEQPPPEGGEGEEGVDGETEAQREAREKRNADRKKALQPEQQPAQRPGGDYVTRDSMRPPPPKHEPPKSEPPKPDPRRR